MRVLLCRFAALLAGAMLVFCAMPQAAVAQEQVRIGIGYGLAFLPFYICEDLKLVEKHAREAHLDVRASFPHFLSAEQLQEAVGSGAIDMRPFGTAALLKAWQSGRDTPQQIFVVSGITSLPLTLLSNQPDEHSLADLKPGDHIAVPTATSPQVYLLQLGAEKAFGQYDRLRGQTVVLSHADAIAALVEASGPVTAYFASPPFTELALRGANVHPIATSSDLAGGKFSFLMLGATKTYIEAQPRMPEVIAQAIDEAARLIHDDPRRAAQIFLTHEPSGTFSGAAMEAVMRDVKDEFGSAVHGVETMAEFMGRHGGLKTVPKSWKDVVAPALLDSSSS